MSAVIFMKKERKKWITWVSGGSGFQATETSVSWGGKKSSIFGGTMSGRVDMYEFCLNG